MVRYFSDFKPNRSLYESIYGSHTDCLPSCVLTALLSFNFVNFASLLLFNDFPACSFIYADLCDYFFTYRPLYVLLFPSGLSSEL